MAYDSNVDYQAKINEAAAKGDYTAAAQYEQQRNEKIAGTGSTQSQTSNYTQYLNNNNSGSSSSGSNATSSGTSNSYKGQSGIVYENGDIGTEIMKKIQSGNTNDWEIESMLADRINRAKADGNLQYSTLDDPINFAANEYIKNYHNQNMGDGKKTTNTTQFTGLENAGTTFDSLLNEWRSAAEQQATNQIDYNTQQGIAELQRALEDAQAQYQTEQNQTALDEAKALDNSALYAEARGDKGGIGQAQYNQIMADALKSKQAIQQAQTQLSTDTARQIADLRSQGEFEKADKLLEISQNYLSKVIELQQWQAQYNLSYAEFQSQLDQWQKEYELSVAQVTGTYNGQPTLAASNDLASLGKSLLSAGIMPSQAQLNALGITAAQAQDYINSLGKSGSGAGTQSTNTDYFQDYDDNGLNTMSEGTSLTFKAYANYLSNGYAFKIPEFGARLTRLYQAGNLTENEYVLLAQIYAANANNGHLTDEAKSRLSAYLGNSSSSSSNDTEDTSSSKTGGSKNGEVKFD